MFPHARLDTNVVHLWILGFFFWSQIKQLIFFFLRRAQILLRLPLRVTSPGWKWQRGTFRWITRQYHFHRV